MTYDPTLHHRRSIRLKGYDYTQPGAYFITINAFHRRKLFGKKAGGAIQLNAWGKIARVEWLKTAALRPEVELDEFVIMPNHMHGIIIIKDCGMKAARGGPCRARTIEQFSKPVAGAIPTIIRSYKSAVTYQINKMHGSPGVQVWQRNYWERVIRNELALSRIRAYIRRNPMR